MQRVLAVVLTLLLIASSTVVMGNSNGKFNASSGCSCHSGGQQTSPTLSGLPSEYTPGMTYTLAISMTITKLRGGFNLEVSQGGLAAAGPGVQTSPNGFQATHTTSMFTSWDVNWTAPSEGSGNVRIELAVLAGNGGGNSGDAKGTMVTNVAEADLANSPPSITSLSVQPSFPTTSDNLTADYSYADSNQDPESGTTYEWYLNGTLMSQHTNATLVANATTRGQTWRVDVTPSDGEHAGETVSSANVTVVNSQPRVVNLTASNLNPSSNNGVNLAFSTVDDDGDIITTAVRWLLDGAIVSSLDGEPRLPSIATRDGDSWVGQVQAADAESVSGWFSTPNITVGGTNAPPTVTSATILDRDAMTSEANLSATYTSSDPEGDPVREVEYRWLQGGTWDPSAGDESTLGAAATQRGQEWSVEVRVSDGSNWSAWSTSEEVTILNAAPRVTAVMNHANATISEGLSLTTTSFDNDGDAVTIIDVDWLMNNELQAAHQGQLLLPSSALTKGERWSASVKFSDGEANITANTETVVLVNAAPSLSVSAPSNTTALAPLNMTVVSSDSDNDTLVLITTWYRNGFRDSTLDNSTFVPAHRLAPGQTWRMEAVVSDGETTSLLVETSRTILNLPPSAVITLLTDNMWTGEEVRVTSASSSDPERSPLSSIWTLNGETVRGEEVTPLLNDTGTLTLTVTDEHGASATTSLNLVASTGPRISGMTTTYEATEAMVDMSWTWNGPDVTFEVWRNGIKIGETDNTFFSDRPPTEGLHSYTIQPTTEDRTYQAAVATTSVQATALAVDTPTTSDDGGVALGAALTVIGIAGLLVSRRRR